MKCRADPAQAPGLGGGGLVWVRVQEHSVGGGSAAVLTPHTHFSLQHHKPPHRHSALFPSPTRMDPTNNAHPSHLHVSPRTNSLQHLPPCIPTSTGTHQHPHASPRASPHHYSTSPIPGTHPLHPHVPPRSPPGTPMLFRDPPSPHTPHAPRCPLCPPGRSALRTAPRPVSREEPPPRYSAVTWRGGCWGCRRRPYIARSGRAARVAGAAGGAAAAVSIPPTSHPSPLPGRGS